MAGKRELFDTPTASISAVSEGLQVVELSFDQ
jgi:hypothetical protein